MRCYFCHEEVRPHEAHQCGHDGSGGGVGGHGGYAPQPATAVDILERGKRILEERAREYEQPDGERSTVKIITAFNAITGHRITETEGWLFLRLLKDVRFFSTTGFHADSGVDLVNYSALMAESKARNGK
jgi:hypothetical protein